MKCKSESETNAIESKILVCMSDMGSKKKSIVMAGRVAGM